MKQIAHRGLSSNNIRENTLEAFDNAVNNGFLGIECDIRLTKDNIPVVSHDAFIDRCSNGIGLVKEKTYSKLLEYNFGTNSIPSKIPTLAEILKRYKCLKLIELKVEINIEPYINYIDDLTYFISFNPFIIKKIKSKYPSLKVGILTSTIKNVKNYKYDIICLLDGFINKQIIEELQKKEIKTFIYGINGKVKTIDKNLLYITDKKIVFHD